MARDLGDARKNKSDEFYTQYVDIQAEMNAFLEYNPDAFRNKVVLLPCDDPEWSNFTRFFAQNFEMLGLKKLISTSYASDSKKEKYNFKDEYYQFTIFDITDFERKSEIFDDTKTHSRGKIFILEKDNNLSGNIDIDDLEWDYLNGDGDFRSDEVKSLRDEADVIITNPPFSLFREFLLWIIEANKEFCIIGNVNALAYKESFPLIKDNKMWLGSSIHSGDREFRVPDNYPLTASGNRIDENGNKFIRVKGVRWFTNIEHGRRHQPLSLMTMSDNLKFSSHKEIKEDGYVKYDNFDAIEVPFSDAIPSDYEGVMGVPITFMDKYCPEQFEILGFGAGELGVQAGVQPYDRDLKPLSSALRDGIPYIYNKENNTIKVPYARIFIRRRK